jgi:hypothetical protein
MRAPAGTFKAGDSPRLLQPKARAIPAHYLTLLLLGAAALLLPVNRARRLGVAGMLVGSMAVASLGLTTAEGAGLARLPVSYLAITAGHLVVALAAFILACWIGWRECSAEMASALPAAGLALVSGGVVTAPVAAAGGLLSSVAVALGLAGTMVIAIGAARLARVADGVAWFDRHVLERGGDPPPWTAAGPRLALVQLAAATLGLAVPQFDLLMLAVLAVLVAGIMFEQDRHPHRRFPLAALFVLAGLSISWYLVVRVAGPQSRMLRALAEAPFSPAFELLLALLLAATAWPLLRLWPVQSIRLGPAAPLAGVILLARAGQAAVPDGLAHWQPVIFPLVVLAVWHGVARGRAAECLTALGVIGAVSGGTGGAWAAVGLVASATLRRLGAEAESLAWPGGAWRRLIWLVPLLLVPVVLQAGLAAEAVYTTMAAWGTIAAAGRAR